MALKEEIENWLSQADKAFFGGKAIEIESPVDVQQSVARLAAVTRSDMFRAPWTEEGLVGQVRPNWVCLQHVKPWQGRNSFRTVLLGSFDERDGKAVLVGYYSIHPIAKAFMAVWLGMLTMFALGTVAAIVIQGEWDKAWVVLIFLAMGGGAWLITFLGKSMSQGDEKWIATEVERVLHTEPADAELVPAE